jgi:hypothetical protein
MTIQAFVTLNFAILAFFYTKEELGLRVRIAIMSR